MIKKSKQVILGCFVYMFCNPTAYIISRYFFDTEQWLLLCYRRVQILYILKLLSFTNLCSILVCISNISRDLNHLAFIFMYHLFVI